MSLNEGKPTLIMGARGSVGRHVLEGLLDLHLPVRASARKPELAQSPRGVEFISADLTDLASLATAFAGVGKVFLYAHLEGVDGVIEAARAAGVETIVVMSSGSVIHPTSAGNAITEEHRAVEAAFATATDLTVIPIRPLVLASNALGWSWSIKADETLPLYKPDARTAPIHERDVAAVAVHALVEGPSATVSAMLTGPAETSQRDQVATIGAATGKTITITELGRDDALARFSRFMPAGEAAAVVEFLDDAAAGNSPASTAVADVLGHPPIGFDAWAVEHVDDFR